MLALSAFHAIRDAVASVGDGRAVALDAPATAEAIVEAVARRITPVSAAPASGGTPAPR
jgi:xanthine dehydrogenase molybdopterin-binding subunit B